MIVRHADEHDLARAVMLLRDSRDGAGFGADDGGPTGFSFPFIPAYAAKLFEIHVAHERMCCLLLDIDGTAQGILMAVADEHPFGPVRIARETVWWISPSHRGRGAIRMLDAYEAWAHAQGCQYVGMAGMGKDPDVGKLYRRRGYRVAETHFLKAQEV